MNNADAIYTWFPALPLGWQKEAACRRLDVNTFTTEHNTEIVLQALRVCNRCKVQDKCLEYALNLPSPYGVWGGMTGRELREMKRHTRAPVRHGTSTGYTQHCYRGETPCSLCRAAHVEAQRVANMNRRWERGLDIDDDDEVDL